MNNVAYAYTRGGTRLKLTLLGSGGEGAVYAIEGHPNRVAKLYHSEPDDQRKRREAKIEAMVAIGESAAFRAAGLTDDIAWPLSPLYADEKRTRFIGFGMKRITATEELDDLYVYPAKQNTTMSTRDRVTCLISLCSVTGRLHRAGQIIGDFNPNNIKIRSDGSVCIVDADSCHVANGGRTFRCVVCAPGYVAPELIRACRGTTYADCPGQTFTKETDRFALAIHIFRMLMNGCHPFICERQLPRAGSAPAPKSIDKRVENGETPFFRSIPNHVAPQYAPDIRTLPPYLCDLFRRAFVDGHANPSDRPTPGEWEQALTRYRGELVRCRSNRLHDYWKGNRACPYCAADARFRQKMAAAFPTGRTTAPPPGNAAKNSGTRPPAPAVTAAAAGTRTHTVRTHSGWFWFVTLTLTVFVQTLLGMHVLPGIYAGTFDSEALASFGVAGSVVSGFVGTIHYNRKWARGKPGGGNAWWEYFLSVFTGIGFAFGFVAVLSLMTLALRILLYLVIGAVIVAVLAGIVSGG